MARSQGALSQDPTAAEQSILRTLLGRLRAPGAHAPSLSVADTVRSLEGEVVKTFMPPAGTPYNRVTIRIRTRHARWQHDGGSKAWTRSADGTVGWYTWRWETSSAKTATGRHLTVTADNTLMLDPVFTASNERSVLGRLMNEVLLYHELLHGQLLMNAMDTPQWRERLCRTGAFDASARDTDHAVIRGLEREFLLRRAGINAITVAPSPQGKGSFTIEVTRVPTGFEGKVSMAYQLVADSNVRDLRLELPRRGADAGKVIIRGEFIDPRLGGFFLATLEHRARA